MTITPEQRLRYVELMARAIWESERDPKWDKPWTKLIAHEQRAWRSNADTALTALLTVANVTWKQG